MKCLQRCCCLLCALVLSLTVFSTNVHASSNSTSDFTISVRAQHQSDANNFQLGTYTFNPSKSEMGDISGIALYGNQISKMRLTTTYRMSGYPLIEGGMDTKVTIQDLFYFPFLHNSSSSFTFYDTSIDTSRILLFYNDGTMEYIDSIDNLIHDGSYYDFEATFTPSKDVAYFELILTNIISMSYVPSEHIYLKLTCGSVSRPTTISIKQPSEESGLLSGILGWVQNIFNKVGDTFDTVVQGFANIGKWFSELPGKLWNVISEGLKNLFVPDEDFIVQYKEDMNSMLEEKLGAVYQVVDITLESWDRITASDEQNTINLPKTTIPLPEGNTYSFGGYDVKIVPQGFEFLASAIKTIGGILVTILFVNGLRKRYDEIMGVEQ